MVLVDSLRRSVDGMWRSFEVGVDLSRQNGKGGMLEGRQLTGLFVLKEPLQVYSSHQFDTSLEAFRRLRELIEGSPDLSRQVKRIVAVAWRGGHRALEGRGGRGSGIARGRRAAVVASAATACTWTRR
jgi:hypothetical protein